MKSSGQTLGNDEAAKASLPPSDVMRSNPADPTTIKQTHALKTPGTTLSSITPRGTTRTWLAKDWNSVLPNADPTSSEAPQGKT